MPIQKREQTEALKVRLRLQSVQKLTKMLIYPLLQTEVMLLEAVEGAKPNLRHHFQEI